MAEWDGKDHREYSMDEIVSKSVEMTLTRLGFDMSDPIEIQKDINHLRRSREICELIQNKAIAGMIGLILMVLLGIGWTGLSDTITDKNFIQRLKK